MKTHWLLMILLTSAIVFLPQAARAYRLNHFMRSLGWGWSDGYHAPGGRWHRARDHRHRPTMPWYYEVPNATWIEPQPAVEYYLPKDAAERSVKSPE